MEKRTKIMAIASSGGHWVQLLRIRTAFDGADVVYVSTHTGYKPSSSNEKFYSIPDANRWNKLRLIKMANKVRQVIQQEKPDIVISTGAAPGLAGLLFGKLYGCKTVWIDSIANIEKISLSGRLIKPFTDLHLTQWPMLANGKTKFKGTVIS